MAGGAAAAGRAEALEKLCEGYKSSKFPDCPELRPQQLWETMTTPEGDQAEAPVIVVDVRRREEQEVSMLPGAITQIEFETRQDQLKDKQICCYCTVGYRSGIYANSLRGKGYEACNLRGSILAWTQEGLPLVRRAGDTEEATKQVHTFGKEWETLHGDGYEPVIFRQPLLKGLGQMLGGLW